MAALNTIYNLVQCGLSSVLGTGVKDCKLRISKATSIWFTPKGFEFDGTQTLDETYAQLLQAQGNLIVLKGARTFTDNSSDDVFETLDDGTKLITTLGLYEFGLTFINGFAFQAALHSLNSFGDFDVLFVDRDGNILGTEADSGALKGFSVGYLQGMKLMFATDSVSMKQGIGFQLTVRSELDTDAVLIQHSNLGTFRPQNLDGINEVVLAFTTAPADTDTTLVTTAKLKQNQQAFVGAVTADFLVTINSATESQTTAETPDGTYTHTVTAVSSNDIVTVQLYDTVNSRSVINFSDGDLYKSNTLTATVV